MSFSSYYESDQEIPWNFVSDLHKDTYNRKNIFFVSILSLVDEELLK